MTDEVAMPGQYWAFGRKGGLFGESSTGAGIYLHQETIAVAI